MVDIVAKVAEAITKAFPELEKRVMAVAEAELNKERTPRLPACLVALLYETGGKGALNMPSRNPVCERFVVDFWFAPVLYDKDGKEVQAESASAAVYYAYYPYDVVRDRLLSALSALTTDQCGQIFYTKLEIGVTGAAVTLTFSFEHHWNWTADDYTDDELSDARRRRIIFKGFSVKGNDHGSRQG